MATGSMPIPSLSTTHVVKSSVRETAWELLRALGSLKITVVMFLAANFLLFVGTLAQDEKSLPEVKAEYFNCWVAQVPFSDFFPVTIFGESTLTGWFPFPGGATIGLILLVNLIAAKATRFHIAAKGSRLLWGGVVSVVGGLLALLVILTGHQTDGLQGKPPIAYETVWQLMQIGSAVAAVGLAAVALSGKRRRLVRISLAIAALSAGGAAVGMLFGGESWRMNEPGLRIMWQLMQSSVASLVLLAGLIMVFGARGGNVLIHIAVGMLMFGQFAFGDRQIEERLNLVEGQTSNMVCRTDEIELACIEVAEETETKEDVTAISGRLLKARAGGEPIALEDLPFDIKVLEYLTNTSVTRVGPFAENRATAGLGKSWLAIGRPPEGGASSKSNVAAAYVQLVDRKNGKDLGVFLVPQFLNDRSQLFMEAEGDICDTVDTASGPWRIQLRFRREYKPYEVRLDDVRRINYSASETPRDYSSFVTFTDEATGTEQPGRIWMNNPVRYRGETFFQSNYSKIQLADGSMSEMTGLQVVENAGWLIPYVACVLAFWGMLAHFGGTFVRFADRHEREGENKSPDNEAAATVGRDGMRGKKKRSSQIREPNVLLQKGWLAPVLALSLVGLIALPAARVKKSSPDASDWSGAGEIPVMHEGRVKPLDTVARNTLQLLSNRTSVEMPETEQGPNGKISATQWLLAAMADSDWVGDAPVFRIDAREVLDLFDLTRRSGHRYTLNELQGGREALQKQIAKARELLPEERTFFQKKCAEINRKLMVYDVIRFAYDTPVPPRIDGADEEARQEAIEQLRLTIQRSRLLDNEHPPAVIPPQQGAPVDQVSAGPANEWQSLYSAVTRAMVARMFEGREGQPAYQPNPAIFPFLELLAVVDGQPSEFNGKLKEYKSAIRSFPVVKETAGKADFEAWYNGFNPTSISRWLYLLAIVLSFISFLAWRSGLNQFVSWLLLGTLILHTFAIGARIWLTGRPPVVNLYSSAIFIGWGCVVAGLALEVLFRMGIGNLAAALSGALTLMVAYGLDTGDTMHVLQAVLDTQFWLSTHVVTVTLGYGATLLAGLLGTCALVHRMWVGRIKPAQQDTKTAAGVQDRLYRMTYGVVCFALFFSFIGTVLGGLWADDSWGRFWGWDPKENGALMIVLWNAAVLHARWDRWIGQRGFALFAIGGNIITAWSWFGTNQLGIGLHSYGFTSGVLMLLGGYVLSQLLLIALGFIFTRKELVRV